jgi:GNAT superfamily N-acetyltransferase
MAWHLTSDLGAFDDAAGDHLRSAPVSQTLPLTVLDTLRLAGPHAFGSPDPPLFGWWTDESGRVAGAFVQTPPYPLVFARTPDAALPGLVTTLLRAGRPVAFANGETATAGEFARLWTAATAASAHVVRHERLFRLDELVPLEHPPTGSPRSAGQTDRDTLIALSRAFHAEAIGPPRPDPSAQVDARLRSGGYTLWSVDGETAAFAGASRAVEGVARIGPVYTAPEHRRCGYGSAATAARTAATLDAGAAEVVLFTDLANPTSNSIYRKLGYVPVEDRVILGFAPPDREESPA